MRAWLPWPSLAEGNVDEAAAFLAGSLRLANKIEKKEQIYYCFMAAAGIAAQQDETARAARLLGASDALREEIGLAVAHPTEQKQRARIESVLDGDDAAPAAQSE